ncbi:MAG: FHA domain-containing protein [Clostridia bacterium]|nr:FHA domain-containing protein [Clostridia bacterium]
MNIRANKDVDSFTFVLTNDEMQQIVLPQWNELMSANAANGFQFAQNNSEAGTEITFFAEGRELLANVMESADQETALKLFLRFAQLVFTENIEQNYLVMFIAAFYDGEKFTFLKPLVPVPQQKIGVLKGFIFGMSNSVAGFDAGLKERLLQACDSAQSVEAFEAVTGISLNAPAEQPQPASPASNEVPAPGKVCPSCARDFPPTSNFCPHCGVQLVVKEIAAPVEESAPEAPVFEAPAFEEPAQPAPVFETPVEAAPVSEAPVVEAPAEEPAFEVPAEEPAQAEPVFEVPAAPSGKVCPSCARDFPPTSNFCPHCGVQLVVKEIAAPMATESAFEAPAVEAPVEEPVQEAPAVEAPVEEPVQEAPAVEAPVEEPVQEAPAVEAPVEEPVQEAPAVEAPVEEPVQETPAVEAPVEASVPAAPADSFGKVCPSCARDFPPTSNFCPHCGVQLVVKEIAAPAPAEAPVPVAPVFEAPVEESVPEAPVFEAPAEEPEPEAPAFEAPAEEPLEEVPAVGEDISQSEAVSGDDEEETTILSNDASAFTNAYLVRKANNEKIYITKKSFIIGKSNNYADYVVTDNKTVSRCHASITADGNHFYIADKDSTNHTFVNGKIISANEPVELYDGDVIMLSNEAFNFHLESI